MNISEVRNSLDDSAILHIMEKYSVKPVLNTASSIIFPTCCHNLNGGSPKLYYYKNSHLFKCFTQCEGSFDIFELIIKMEKLRGNDITLFDAVKIAGINPKDVADVETNETQQKIDYMYEFVNTVYKMPNLEPVDESVLNASIFQKNVLSIWENEGISLNTMQKYKIGYDPIANCITIPIYDHMGKLVSVRGRFLAEEENVKYRPITFCNKILAAPSSQILYGLYQNISAIKNTKTAKIFESEKSVLMMDTYYGEKNNSVATLGKNISNQHIMLLKNFGVEEVIVAYDADYISEKQKREKFREYKKVAQSLAPFFSTSIIIDWNSKLKYKDSPIDCGKNIFEDLLKDRFYVKF